jgi:dipeptidyl aminopeptidase/acylaminoacyl peptidase
MAERLRMDSIKLKRRRDSQQWILDWVIKQTGRTHCFEQSERILPPEVKSHAMIPAILLKAGSEIETIARKADEAGDFETARGLYFKAVGQYHLGQHAIFEQDNDNKVYIHERIEYCYSRIVELSEYPIEIVEIPWEGKTIQGILHLLPGRPKAPVCLFIPGMDMIKEIAVDPDNNPFMKRNMHVLAIDGPGQGISCLREIFVTEDNYERAASECISYLINRPEVNADKIVSLGCSMGSYWGVRLMALDKRIKASAQVAACYSGKRHIFEMSSPRFKQIFMNMAGMDNEEIFDEMAAKMHLQGYAKKIDRPILLTAGEYDPLTPLEDTLTIFDEISGPKELWIYENGFHGGVREGIPNLGNYNMFAYVIDWMRKVINGKVPDYFNIKRLIPTAGYGPYGHEVEDFSLRSRYKDKF